MRDEGVAVDIELTTCSDAGGVVGAEGFEEGHLRQCRVVFTHPMRHAPRWRGAGSTWPTRFKMAHATFLTLRVHELVLESQLPHKTVKLFF